MSNDNDELERYKFCPECGTEALNRPKFCGECGRSLLKQVVPASGQISPPQVTPEVAAVEDPSQSPDQPPSPTSPPPYSALPPPQLWPLRTEVFYQFAVCSKLTFSWHKSKFRITKHGFFLDRTLHTFPLTEKGWADAWRTMAGQYPLLAEAVAIRATALEAERPSPSPIPREPSQPTPSGVLVLGSMLGWGPWSAGIGLWLTYGNSGYTLRGQSASTSAVHAVCQAGGAISQPGICGSVDAHWAYGVALIVVGIFAFVSGIVGLFVLQQRNPQAWRRAGGPIIAGLIFGIFAVIINVARAIGRAVKAGDAGPDLDTTCCWCTCITFCFICAPPSAD